MMSFLPYLRNDSCRSDHACDVIPALATPDTFSPQHPTRFANSGVHPGSSPRFLSRTDGHQARSLRSCGR